MLTFERKHSRKQSVVQDVSAAKVFVAYMCANVQHNNSMSFIQ